MRLAAQYGVGVPVDIATSLANAAKPGSVDKTLGSKLRNLADATTAPSQMLNSSFEFLNGGRSPEDVYDQTKDKAVNRAAQSAAMRNRVPAAPAPMGADDQPKVEPK
jgi:hypothetical protein